MDSPTARIAHFSDVHVTCAGCRWRLRDWFTKRVTSSLNWRFHRAKVFCRSTSILAALAVEFDAVRFDHLIFSGDATALGFEEEIARAAQLLHVARRPGGGLAVPGNHDYCTALAARTGAFERYFAPWQAGRRVDASVYPFAQRVGPIWLVAVNSATANRWPWDASGAVGAEQLARLERLLRELDPGPRVLVTHYPIARATGRPEKRSHGLRDLSAVLDVAHKGGVRLWLHGHNHGPYYHATGLAPFPTICAGSATQESLWTYCDYTFTAEELTVQRRVYDPDAARFRDGERFTLSLSRMASRGC